MREDGIDRRIRDRHAEIGPTVATVGALEQAQLRANVERSGIAGLRAEYEREATERVAEGLLTLAGYGAGDAGGSVEGAP